MSYTDIHTYDQISTARETMRQIEDINTHNMDAPDEFYKFRDGGFYHSDKNYQIHININTKEKAFKLGGYIYKVNLSVRLYQDSRLIDEKHIIGHDLDKSEPKHIELWSDLTGIMLNIYNYEKQAQDAINELGTQALEIEKEEQRYINNL